MLPPVYLSSFSHLKKSLYRAIVSLSPVFGGPLWLTMLQHSSTFATITFLIESNSDLCCRATSIV